MRALVVLLCLLTGPAFAGPWPRDPGSVYVYSGHEIGEDGAIDGWSSLYAEVGLPRGFTATLDTGGHLGPLTTGALPDGRVALTLGRPILSSDEARARRPAWLEPWRLGVEAGLGYERRDDGVQARRLITGLSVGRGMQTRFGDGWIAGSARLASGGDLDARANLGAVAGVKPRPWLQVELGLFAEHDDGWSITLAPAAQVPVWRLGAVRAAVLAKDDGTAMQFGWVSEF